MMPSESDPKLNIFALPSQTTVLFILIVSVILAAVLASLLGNSPICGWPLVVGIFLLPIRDFLRQPDRETERHHLSTPVDEVSDLQAEARRLSHEAGLKIIPCLASTRQHLGIYVFGSLRRYLAIDTKLAHELKDRVDAAADNRTWALESWARILRSGCFVLPLLDKSTRNAQNRLFPSAQNVV